MLKFNTLIIGAKGYLGSHFYAYYFSRNLSVLGTHYRPLREHIHFDLASPFDLSFLENKKYDYALLLGGIANPFLCETEPEKTYYINVEQSLKLVQELLDRGILPVLFSSDYVFDGENEGYHPLNQYGREKKALEALHDTCLIIRCSKIYGTKKGDKTIFDLMAEKLAHDQNVIAAVDQIFSPIHVDDVVAGVVQLQQEQKKGLFNFAGNEKISRYSAALTLCKLLGKSEDLVTPISLDDIKDGVKRPKSSFIRTAVTTRSLQASLEEVAAQYHCRKALQPLCYLNDAE